MTEAEIAEHFYGGSASAFEETASNLMDRAGKAFTNGSDDKAKLLRELAGYFRQRGIEERERQDKHRKEGEEERK